MDELKTNTKQTRQRGTTLIELSVVIAVILLLVGVLFIGVTAWKNGANRAACIVNLSSIQKAARGYANMNLLPEGADLPVQQLQNAGFWNSPPQCPSGGQYTYQTKVPQQGMSYAACSQPDHYAPNLEGGAFNGGNAGGDGSPAAGGSVSPSPSVH